MKPGLIATLAVGVLVSGAANSFDAVKNQSFSSSKNIYEFQARPAEPGTPRDEYTGRIVARSKRTNEIVLSVDVPTPPGCAGFQPKSLGVDGDAKHEVVLFCGSFNGGKHETLYALLDRDHPEIAKLDFGLSPARLEDEDGSLVAIAVVRVAELADMGMFYKPVAYRLVADGYAFSFQPYQFPGPQAPLARDLLQKIRSAPGASNPTAINMLLAANSLLTSEGSCEYLKRSLTKEQKTYLSGTAQAQLSQSGLKPKEIYLCK